MGDLFDFGWKANVMNLALLERHAHVGSRPTPGDWLFVLLILAALAAIVLVPILFAAWLLSHVRLI